MSYDNTTPEEPMDATATEQEPVDFGDDEFFFDGPEEPDFSDSQEPDIFDLDEYINDILRMLESFRLTEEQQQTVREFLTLHIQARQAPRDQFEACRARYNLLIHGSDKDAIRRFADILRAALYIRPEESLFCTENDLSQRLNTSSRSIPIPRINSSTWIPDGTRFLLIDECQEAPRLNLDGGGSARDASKKAIDAHNALWKAVLSYIRQTPRAILIVASDEDVYHSTLLPFIELSQRVCGHHILLSPRSEEELFADCMTDLRNSSFSLSDDFEPALKKYFQNAYPAADLRDGAFVSNLIGEICSRFYSRKRDSHMLTADCIPECDPLLRSAESVLGQLNNLVGLKAVKTAFHNLYKMQVAGLTDSEHMCHHMLFAGNPGTGKTTVARMAADLFFHMGILKTNKLVIVKPCDLVSEWIGGTGMKAMEVIRRAYNGVLFIDEAYGIANMDRGEELLNVLLQEMENHSDKLIIIFAGYIDEMRELLKANPGLGSRISQEIRFDDYTPEELSQIFLQMCKKDGFTLDPSARDELDDCISALMTKEFFGNARDMQSILQDLKEAWSDEYYEAVTKHGHADMKKVFLPRHFEKIMPPKKEGSINDLIGLDILKKKLEVFKRQAMYQKHLREKGFTNLSDFSMHMIFTGNPGTGKTTVAKLIADDLYSIGMLKTNRLVVAERKDLVSAYGDTAQKAADVIRKAVGGVLFIDEAYALIDSHRGGMGSEAIEVFLTAMEEHISDTVFIFAGYVDEMQDFLTMNPGIQSRIGYTFHFDDYSPDELTRMYAEKMRKTGFVVSEGALDRVREIMEYFQDVKNFGNGRFVNHVIHQTISQRANRDFTKQYRNIHSQDIPSIKTLIETAPNSMQLYDPASVTPEDRYRTAVHEVGHAVIMVGTDPENIPTSISIRNHAGSLGRVSLAAGCGNRTEKELLNHIATLLGGKNAEKLLLGSHSTGCAEDFVRAKRAAEDMIQTYAMTSYGEDAASILKAADQLSMELISKNKERIEEIADILIRKKELTGEEFLKAMKS